MAVVDGLMERGGAAVGLPERKVGGHGTESVETHARSQPAGAVPLCLCGMGRSEQMVDDRDVKFFVAVGTVGIEEEFFLQRHRLLPLGAVALCLCQHLFLACHGFIERQSGQLHDILFKTRCLTGQ